MTFPSTQWGLLADATLHGDQGARQALDEFCRRYRPPIVRFIRWRGGAVGDAEDLAHDFLVHVMEKSVLRRADEARGRFRSFLLGALRRFLSDVRVREAAQKRGGGLVARPWDDVEQTGELSSEQRMESADFDRAWAISLLELTTQQLAGEHRRRGAEAEFAVLRAFLPGALSVPTYEAAATQLGRTLTGFKAEVHRLRARYRALLRAEIARTVATPQEIDEEIAYLGRVVRRSVVGE